MGYRDEDDDDFIYGAGATEPDPVPAPAQPQTTSVFEPQPIQPIQPLEDPPLLQDDQSAGADDNDGEADAEASDNAEENEEEEDEESDIEIIVEQVDKNKSQGAAGLARDFRPSGTRTASFDPHTAGTPPPGPRAPHLTTEYTPTPRGEVITRNPPPLQSQSLAPDKALVATKPQSATPPLPTYDPSTLPPVRAPPSHPPINPSEPGVLEGRSIFEIDMDALSEKPWRRPGSDISDYFNYGFDEISWEAYCYRRRDLGDMANHLKSAVSNFSGLPDDQVMALPPEVRAMVMTGATSLMSGPALPHAPPQMIGVGGPGPMMHPHEMGMMGMMNSGEMPQGPGMMPGQEDGMGIPQEGFQQGAPGPAQMMGMGQEFGMQEPNPIGMFHQNMDGGATPGPVPGTNTGTVPTGPGAVPGPTPAPAPALARGGPPQSGFRGRPMGSPAMGIRGRGGFGRGRGRGGMFTPDGPAPPIPVRPASPLPPGVPTGPRNQNRYKDRDGNAPAVDGLDYGGTQGGSADTDERGNPRKRRGSPSQEDSRSLKRR